MQRLVQELKGALQQQQMTQQAATSVQQQALTAQRHQQEHAEENAALKHEIQVWLNLIVLVILCGRGRELTSTSGIPRRKKEHQKAQASGAGSGLHTANTQLLSGTAQSTTVVYRMCNI